MAKTVTAVVNSDGDERVLQQLAAALRGNDIYSEQLRSFAEGLEKDQRISGLQFQPKPGHVLVCHFGLGCVKPEMIKTRPVLVVSPNQRQWTKLCLVLPISSKAPLEQKPYHFKLPKGLVPGKKYEESWIKGDLIAAVGCRRLDRIKVGFRQYVAPRADEEVLKAARRCILHAGGMHSLTVHW